MLSLNAVMISSDFPNRHLNVPGFFNMINKIISISYSIESYKGIIKVFIQGLGLLFCLKHGL